MNIPLYAILFFLFVGISGTTAFAVINDPDGITADVSGGNSIITAKSNGGNAVIKMADKGSSSYAFTVFDNSQRLDITDIGQGQLRISIIENGNVGIGTATPSERLFVQGNIGLTGNIIPTGDLCIGTCP